jgi:hypothetical protein
MANAKTSTNRWHFWRWFRQKKLHFSAAMNSSLSPDIEHLDRKATVLERIGIGCALLVVCSVIVEDWDVLPMIFHPATKEGIRAIGGIGVAVFIVLEILFGFLSAKAEHVVRDWNAERIATLNRRTERLRRKNRHLSILARDRRLSNCEAFIAAMRMFSGTRISIRVMKQYGLDPESDQLEELLRDCLIGAAWVVESPVPNRLIEPPAAREGVHIEFPPLDWYADTMPPYIAAGCALADWLNKNHIGTDIDAPHATRSTDTVVLRIGPKPSTLRMMRELRWIGNWRRWRGIKRPPEYDPISPEDAQTIRTLLAQVNRREDQLLRFAEAKSIEDIRNRDLGRVLQVLKSILRRVSP